MAARVRRRIAPRSLAGTEGAQLPAWSPSGDAVLFFAGTHLRRLHSPTARSVTSPTRRLPPVRHGFLTVRFCLRRSRPAPSGVCGTATITDATTPRPGDRAHVFPVATGTGNDFVYTAVAENGRRTVRLVHDRRGARPRGDLRTRPDRWRLPARRARRRPAGAAGGCPTRNTSGAKRRRHHGCRPDGGGRSLFVASPRVVLSAASSPRARELAWFDMNGQRTGTMGEAGDLWQVRLSPDDRTPLCTLAHPFFARSTSRSYQRRRAGQASR